MRARIALLPGDGVGPEVAAEGVRVLRAVEKRYGHTFEVAECLIGGGAIDADGAPLPSATRECALSSDAVLLGAVGGPKWSDPTAPMRPEDGLLALRAALGVFANVRPVRLLDAGRRISPLKAERLVGVDLVIVRELTGGLYYGEKHRERTAIDGDVAWETCRYSTREIERVVRVAATFARTRRGKLTSVDKANVMGTSRLWREVTTRVMGDEFPDVVLDHVYVDACAMYLVREPGRFDVIVTENLFGDILTDESAVLAGSIGLLPSASLGASVPPGVVRRGLYEPIHGSAPDIAGQAKANPVGMILSVAMMLRHSFALEREAVAVERAVSTALQAGHLPADLVDAGHAACTTSHLGQEIARRIAET